jgi:hypothetical protein
LLSRSESNAVEGPRLAHATTISQEFSRDFALAQFIN